VSKRLIADPTYRGGNVYKLSDVSEGSESGGNATACRSPNPNSHHLAKEMVLDLCAVHALATEILKSLN